jgi:hypothetical protein
MKVVTAAESIAAIRAKGLDQLGGTGEESTDSYFLMKWGINRSAGIIKNAGKVIRLKIPKTTTKARIADANAEDRCCKDCQLVFQQTTKVSYLILHNPMNQNKTPSHSQCLYRIRKGMGLVRPSNI